jgi:hypothetical protein
LAQGEDYRFKARECEARAQFVRDPNIRRMWEALARQWHELADELERILGNDDDFAFQTLFCFASTSGRSGFERLTTQL